MQELIDILMYKKLEIEKQVKKSDTITLDF